VSTFHYKIHQIKLTFGGISKAKKMEEMEGTTRMIKTIKTVQVKEKKTLRKHRYR